MYKKIKGIIISEYPFEETSKIINIFTETGIIGLIAKGAKRPRSPFFGTTTRFTYGEFNIQYKENNLSKLIDADVIENYTPIKKDITKISYATYITELITKVYKHDNHPSIYRLYQDSLQKINENLDPRIITDIVSLKLLEHLGIKPIIDKCVTCGSQTGIVTISSYLGGYLCQNCYQNEKIVNTKTIKLLRMFYLVDISKITKLDISENILKELEEFINDYYERYSGIYLKSKTLLETIK